MDNNFAVLGGIFSLALGLLIGSVFNTVRAAASVLGPVIPIFILAGIIIGPLGQLQSSSPVAALAKALPTYYIAEDVYNASKNLGLYGSHLGATLGSTIVLLVVSALVLRRKSAVEVVI